MNTLKGLNEAIEYIENNLCSEIDFDAIYKIAGCSEYHFKRVFSYFAGVSLGEYIRARRLSVAVELLQKGDKKVIDVGIALGYETPEAFTRAFRAMHGVNPATAKSKSTQVKVFLPLDFKLSISGGIEMKVKIVQKEKFSIVGFKKRITMQFSGVNNQVSELFARLTPSVINQLKALSNTEPYGIISVSTNFTDRTAEGSKLDQYVGVATTQEESVNKTDFDVLQVGKCTYAVFESVGKFPDALQNTWAEIFSQWLPTSGYHLPMGQN